jgi:CheY-like chemotaxis protein
LNPTVLVVDDDLGVQETLEAILEFEGYNVMVAGDGLEALKRLDEQVPALIVLDIMMPRMDGFAFALALEERGLRPEVPILVLTADGRAQQKAERARAESYLHKPFEVTDLLDKVEQLVRR